MRKFSGSTFSLEYVYKFELSEAFFVPIFKKRVAIADCRGHHIHVLFQSTGKQYTEIFSKSSKRALLAEFSFSKSNGQALTHLDNGDSEVYILGHILSWQRIVNLLNYHVGPD